MAKKKADDKPKTKKQIILKKVSIVLKKKSCKDLTPSVNSLKGLGLKISKTILGFIKGTLPNNTLSFVVGENGLILSDDCLVISDIHGKRVMIPVSQVVLVNITTQ